MNIACHDVRSLYDYQIILTTHFKCFTLFTRDHRGFAGFSYNFDIQEMNVFHDYVSNQNKKAFGLNFKDKAIFVPHSGVSLDVLAAILHLTTRSPARLLLMYFFQVSG